MLSIGELAQRTRTSRRMLRHWEEVGLLSPARVDPWTRRRVYDPRQTGRVRAIVALRSAGFGLPAIERGHDIMLQILELSPLPAIELAAVAEIVRDETEIAESVTRLLDRLGSPTAEADLLLVHDGNTDTITVSAGWLAGEDPRSDGPGTTVLALPATERGAQVTFPEPPPSIADAWDALDAELERQTLRTTGPYRQVRHATLAAPVLDLMA